MRFVPKPEADREKVRLLVQNGIAPEIAALLVQRGVDDPQAAGRFLNPSALDLHDPMLLHDMAKAVTRIEEAIAHKERMVLYGDYDADGVTAVSVLLGYFESRGVFMDYYIPARHEEGYGLNDQAVRELSKDHTLMITVDCGIASHEEVELAKSLGLEVIVTDHHQLKPTLPQAYAVINPLIGDYPCPFLCGAGVALKLVQALGGLKAAMREIDLAAIGTVADIVPLLDENRAIAHLGIQKMNENRRIGIDALCKVAHLGEKPIDAGHIGFLLGPRINAGGRIDKSGRTVELMTTDDPDLAQEIADQLESHNLHRQQLEREITADCEKKIENEIDFLHDRAIVLWGENWNVGVVGIVASRMTEKYAMPCILLSKVSGALTGSGRSVRGVHLLNAISACDKHLTRFGGHEMAAGLGMEIENFENFRRDFNEYLRKNADPDCFVPTASYDMALSPDKVTLSLIGQLSRLAPFGMGNPTVQFLFENVSPHNVRTMGQEGRHIRAILGEGGDQLECVGFSMAEQMPVLKEPCDLIVQLSENTWGGKTHAQAVVRKAKRAKSAFSGQIEFHGDEIMRDFFAGILYNKLGASVPACRPFSGQIGRGDLVLVLDVQNAFAPSFAGIEKLLFAPQDDKRAFPALVCAPKVDVSFGHYRRFIFADGFDALLAQQILEVCPQAQFFSWDTGLNRRRPLPDVPAMRRIYSLIAKKSGALNVLSCAKAAAEKIAAETQVTPLEALCSLMVFDELGFMRAGFDPWMLYFCPGSKKTDLNESRIYRYFDSLGENAD